MFRMEIDSSPESATPSALDIILQNLSRLGVPEEDLNGGQSGLVAYLKKNRSCLPDLAYAILPNHEWEDVEDVYRESLSWLQWLMFECEPKEALEQLYKSGENERGVCGSVWGNNDIAYRCRTCEHDPTCAICVPCFENGNHKEHDYSVIYTGGGCCDCGDVTAWKREGFCSRHRGSEQIQPLPENFVISLGPVLDLLLSYWTEKLHCAKRVSKESPRSSVRIAELQKASEELTCAVVEMLLNFCKHSESLLSFISGRVHSTVGLLDALLRAEGFMNVSAVEKLHELLLKLLGEPVFKYEFAKIFVSYYPMIVDEAIKEFSDTVFKKYTLLSSFSVQILTVPTLTPRLVEEVDLMAMLLQCLENVFVACGIGDGRLEVLNWAPLHETSLRVVEDIRFVMSHSVVPKYLCRSRRDLVKTWMRLLASVQGMNSQRRETGNHIEDENENVHLPFVLCHSLSNILSLLVNGAFLANNNLNANEEAFFNIYEPECEDLDGPRLSKVGRLSRESYFISNMGKSSLAYESLALDFYPIPSSALWFVHECLSTLENWLVLDNTVGPLNALSLKSGNESHSNLFTLKRTLSKFGRGKYMFKSSSPSSSKVSTSSEAHNKQSLSPSHVGLNIGVGQECSPPSGQETGLGNHEDGTPERESTSEVEKFRVLNLSLWPDITFDVSSQDVSVNIPLHRLLSMVLRSALKECYGESSFTSIHSSGSADPVFTRSDYFLTQVLEGCHPCGFSAFVMEHPLRIRVFYAQVRAGMWRRNGDAPILFSEWYRSVRWSEQGQELDLFLLQCCAALAPADLYVKRILERFGLSEYLSLSLDLSSEHEPVLAAEMLTLLIQIVKERRFCGSTTAECLQRELVYKLSIGDATRSQLIKSLPRDLSKTNKLQNVLDTIAEYSHPSGMTQGMYKLRSLYWKELDMYHPRWNSRDLQSAEERYLRFCNVSASTAQLPRWTNIYYPLRGLAEIATCKSVLQIVRAVLFYAVFTFRRTVSRAPDSVLLNALHLLALALDVCRVHQESGEPLCSAGDVIPILAYATEEISSSKYGDQSMLSLLVSLMKMHARDNAENFIETEKFSFPSLILSILHKFAELELQCKIKLQKLAPDSTHHFSYSVSNDNIRVTESPSESEKHKTKARERQAAILERMRNQQSKFLESVDSKADDEMDDTKSEEEVCGFENNFQPHQSSQVICSLCHDSKSKNPVSYLVLLQKSRLLSFVSREPPSWEQICQSDKAPVSSAATNNSIPLSSISNSSEIISSSKLLDVVHSALNVFATVGQPDEVDAFLKFVKARFPSFRDFQLPCISKDTHERGMFSLETFEEHMFMLIKDTRSSFDNSVSPEKYENLLTVESSIEKSKSTGSLLLGKYIAALPKEPADSPSGSRIAQTVCDRMQDHSIIGPSGGDGVYISSCGHAVHQGCLDRYLSSLRERYTRRIVFEGGHIVDPDMGEFLCPVCRGLSNAVLPALPVNQKNMPLPSGVSVKKYVDVSFSSISGGMNGSLRLCNALSLLQKAATLIENEKNKLVFQPQNMGTEKIFEPILRLLCGMYYPDKGNILNTGRVSSALILWDILRYSLISIEIAARSRKSFLKQNYCLSVLYKELNSSSGFILFLLLNATQYTRASNFTTSLLRLRGIQLFAKSFYPDMSINEYSNHSSEQEGNLLYILENAEAEVRYPDIKLWSYLSAPVLAGDAFSSLIWILFCLPLPVLTCRESYLDLVHAFYVVTVIQAIISYSKQRQSVIRGLQFHDCLITDIEKAMGDNGKLLECFDTCFLDPAYGFNDSIRSLAFPYLRRCVLLWKLINRTSSVPFNHGNHSWDETSYDDDYSEFANYTAEELSEVEKLEKIFSIPPLNVIIDDKRTRLIASRWLHNLSVEAEKNKSQSLVRCNPASPFKLLHLPHLYQDLLQRYIKRHCYNCGAVKEEPALCLLCGKLCSPNWKTCCRETGCQVHAMNCGSGIGVFLLIRRTTILLQRSARQAPWPSPYLDAFGEEDVEMHRGKPLFLNEERYAALSHMVASHGLDRSSKVLRQTTTGSFFVF